MNCIPCVVFPTAGQEWMAHLESGPVGPFIDRDLALQVAIIEALRLRQSNRPARLVIRDRAGNVCAERCLCRQFGR